MGFSNSEGKRVTRGVKNKGVRGLRRPKEVSGEGEKVGEGVGERLFEALGYGIQVKQVMGR